MSERTEAHLWIESEPALAAVVTSARWTEQLGALYELEIELTVEDPDFDVEAALGRSATLTLTQAPLATRHVCGVVFAVASNPGEMPDGTTPRAVRVVPALQLLGLDKNSRIFQDMSVPQIVQAVLEEGLGAHGREVSMEQTGAYAAREYCVQYQESDLAFVERLLAEEGMYWSFAHPAEGAPELLVIHDSVTSLPELVGEPLRFDPTSRVWHGPVVLGLERAVSARTNMVAVHDHDWTGPRAAEAGAEADTTLPPLEDYAHGHGRALAITSFDEAVGRYQADDASAQAQRRVEAHQVDAATAHGSSVVAELAAGGRVSVTGHPSPGFDADYVITQVEHRFSRDDAHDGYRCRFQAIDAGTPFRPPRAPGAKPRIAGMQTAIVVGPAGEEIHTDQHGRVKVQFHWDREGAGDEHSSCWLRVRQAWAGDGWGFLFLPRIGMEVVVHFLAGDPDRPVVTGCVYDGRNTPPYALPGEKTKSTIKTNSSLGGGGFNELRFEDEAGAEQVFLHAQKDLDEIVLNDHTTTVGGDQSNHVTGNQAQNIGDWQEETVDANQEMTVTKKRTVTVGGTFDENIDTGETRSVTGSSTETIEKGELRLVLGPNDETISDKETRTVAGGLAEVCIGPYTQTINGASERTATSTFTKTVTGALTVTTPGTMGMTAVGGVQMEAAGPITTNGGPLVTHTTVSCTEIYQTHHNFGILKWAINVMSYAGYGIKAQVGGFSTSQIGMKFELLGLKVDGGGKKSESGVDNMDSGAIKTKAGAMIKYLAGLVVR